MFIYRRFNACRYFYVLVFILTCSLFISLWSPLSVQLAIVRNFLAGEIVDFAGADNETGFSTFIIPNVVHFVRLENHQMNFVDVVTLKAAFLHQSPEKIVIHCDCHTLRGKYWEMVKDLPGLEVKFIDKPTHVFGQKLSSVRHASDIARLKILMSEGGIFLENDVYIVKPLDSFLKFEMVIGWPPDKHLGTQMILAHKNARFLKLWYQSYKYYKPDRLYYNAGELPTEMILERQPNLVHRVPYEFGLRNLSYFLYGVHRTDWKNFHVIHLSSNKAHLVSNVHLEEFDEENIKIYNRTFGDMARLVLFGKTKMVVNSN
ncbi:uncharacterized protein LOC143228818 [Tachypleus tridentatus]|uniref:uncharacterized protein LOC143228818 n=1 Tax=Tachypleus tridentatus TaxID=6853 RepID=UPI003FD2B18A